MLSYANRQLAVVQCCQTCTTYTHITWPFTYTGVTCKQEVNISSLCPYRRFFFYFITGEDASLTFTGADQSRRWSEPIGRHQRKRSTIWLMKYLPHFCVNKKLRHLKTTFFFKLKHNRSLRAEMYLRQLSAWRDKLLLWVINIRASGRGKRSHVVEKELLLHKCPELYSGHESSSCWIFVILV